MIWLKQRSLILVESRIIVLKKKQYDLYEKRQGFCFILYWETINKIEITRPCTGRRCFALVHGKRFHFLKLNNMKKAKIFA